MKMGSLLEATDDCRFNSVTVVKKGFIDECIESGDINDINPFLEGAYVKISKFPELYFNRNSFRELEIPPSHELEIKEALEGELVK
jgi:hypothetical protein